MKLSKNATSILLLWMALVFIIPTLEAQTKQIKRPKSIIGISSVDIFVSESFDIYDKVYKYDGYAEAGTPLEEEEDVLDGLSVLKYKA